MRPFNVATWREDFKDREIFPEQLDRIVKPGSRLFLGSGCSEPVLLTNQLVKENWKFPDVQVLHFFSLSNQKFFSMDNPTSFRHVSMSMIGSPELRQAIQNGLADFAPISTAEIPRMMREQKIPVDVALIQVAPPGRNGLCSFGINVDINPTIIKSAKTVVAHVNPSMPRTLGNSFVRFQEIDYFVFKDHPLLEEPPFSADDVHQKVALNVSRLIENGASLNLGTGKTSYFLPGFLKDKQDLALYGEVFPETVIDLINNGVVTCARNNFPHCMTTFIIGTRKFYDYVHDNPFFEFHPTEFILNMENITRNKKLCSVYGALAVDLLGQASNHVGNTLFSGTGGEPDLMRGAALSRGGKAIVTLPSTTRDGKSRILPFLPPGPIALRDIDIHYVVTEWGIAFLHGKTIRERVLQMISIAAPEHRAWLLEKAKELNYVFKDQILPATKDGVAVICPEIGWTFITRDNGPVYFRPVKATDERLLQEMYYRLSEDDRMHRFLSHRKVFSHEDIQALMACDYQTSMLVVGTTGTEKDLRVVAEGAYYLEPNTNLAEISVTVDKSMRGQGLARHIFEKIIDLARERGIGGIFGEISADNTAIFKILNALPYNVAFTQHEETFQFSFRFSDAKGEGEPDDKHMHYRHML
ncbi:MAG: GNAT family N-acetyltransferase [Candidatus Lokiarchaeota archaeon]|nr:GNAT family N-acetyltransferase [Candidatus Lokiarchaeota archaeon]